MPCRIDNNNFPFEIYRSINNKPALVQTFNDWGEIEEFSSTIN